MTGIHFFSFALIIACLALTAMAQESAQLSAAGSSAVSARKPGNGNSQPAMNDEAKGDNGKSSQGVYVTKDNLEQIKKEPLEKFYKADQNNGRQNGLGQNHLSEATASTPGTRYAFAASDDLQRRIHRWIQFVSVGAGTYRSSSPWRKGICAGAQTSTELQFCA
jgi:hypothetical protein